jgi:hypothetical protein
MDECAAFLAEMMQNSRTSWFLSNLRIKLSSACVRRSDTLVVHQGENNGVFELS